jgi:hypothetical protein
MAVDVFIFFVFVGTVVAFLNWRYGLLIASLVGLLADPVRKMSETRTVYFTLAIAPVYAAMFLNLISTQSKPWRLFRDFSGLKVGVGLLAVVAAQAALVCLLNYGWIAFLLVPLGLVSYFGSFPALVLGYYLIQKPAQLRWMFALSVLMSSLLMTGALFEYWGYEWDVLGTLDRTPWLHHYGWGKYVRMISGFFRGPEILGWHAAMVTMLSITLFLTVRNRSAAFVWLIPGVWGLVCCLLSGRRKMVAMVVVFGAVLVFQLFRQRRTSVGVVVCVAAGLLLMGSLYYITRIERATSYVELSASAFNAQGQERVEGSFYGVVAETINQAGFFGYGLGTISQGAQHLKIERPFTWQESGLGKVVGELGVPGLIVFLIFGYIVVNASLVAVRASAHVPRMEVLGTCLFAILMANAGCFIVAIQVYGDPFISYLMGLLTGCLFSMKRLGASLEAKAVQPYVLDFRTSLGAQRV